MLLLCFSVPVPSRYNRRVSGMDSLLEDTDMLSYDKNIVNEPDLNKKIK